MAPTIIATGSFADAADPLVDLLIGEGEIDAVDVDIALAAGQPVPFIVVLGEIGLSSTAYPLSQALDIRPMTACRRFATPERVAAAARDFELRDAMERAGELEILDLMARFAAAGATIQMVP